MKEKQTNGSNTFSSKVGFILAAAGSAVGLGNLWRFPYLAAKYGGGIFLLIYLVLAVTFGFALMITEIAIGRKTGKSALGAFASLNKKYTFLGYMACLVPVIIFPYYCVIGGWVLKYALVFVKNDVAAATGSSYFSDFIGGTTEPVVLLVIFMIASAAIVVMGVQKGIEKASKILMPTLIILSIFIAVYVMTIDGAKEGILYYIKPDFRRFSMNAVFAAMGQLFYSMSLAMGIMITYGSYMSKNDHLETCVGQIEIFDTGIAFVAGLIIIPSVFAFSNGDTDALLCSGPSLMFVTLPNVFASMKFGRVIGTAFFILVLFAALTSAISLMETLVSMLQEKLNLSRVKLCLIVILVSMLLAVPSALGFGAWSGIKLIGMDILDFFDFISNSVLMPIVAFLTCIFAGYIIKPEAIKEEVELDGAPFHRKRLYRVLIRYIAPVCLILILITSILNTLGINKL